MLHNTLVYLNLLYGFLIFTSTHFIAGSFSDFDVFSYYQRLFAPCSFSVDLEFLLLDPHLQLRLASFSAEAERLEIMLMKNKTTSSATTGDNNKSLFLNIFFSPPYI